RRAACFRPAAKPRNHSGAPAAPPCSSSPPSKPLRHEQGGRCMKNSPLVSRRTALKVGAAAAALPLVNIDTTAAGEKRVLRFTTGEDVAITDPIWTGSYHTRTHGYAVFDTLFGRNSKYEASPQMVEGSLVEVDGKRWTLIL